MIHLKARKSSSEENKMKHFFLLLSMSVSWLCGVARCGVDECICFCSLVV
jgi:hypothetical protein